MNLEARIEHLERRLARWQRYAVTGCLLLMVAFAFGQAAPPAARTIEAAKFVLVDSAGKSKAVLGLEEDGPNFMLYNQEGKPVVKLQVPKIPDKPSLFFLDSAGAPQLELALTVGGPVLHFNDKSGVRARIATNELNAPLAAIYDETGKKLFEVSSQHPRAK